MVSVENGVFYLSTAATSYFFRATKFGHLEHVYYGERLPHASIEPLLLKRTSGFGSSVLYDESDANYCLDLLPLEWSGIGRGDYRTPPVEARLPDGSYASDFTYASYAVSEGAVEMERLPCAYADESPVQTLCVTLRDVPGGLTLLLYYGVYEETNVITRRTVLINESGGKVELRKLMSLSLDLENRGDSLVTFDGAWIREAHRHDRKLQYGMYVNASSTGASSNRHNPGFLLYEEHACEQTGNVYGFNLIYSGNHYGAAELSAQELVRVQLGVNPQCFCWTLAPGERFETPEAIMSFSNGGFNGLSHNFHDFINRHIVRGDWKGRERPVLINDWEACFFDFSRAKLLRLARRASKLGVELFVLDDGWFGARDNDRAGLGDYRVNKKKLPGGLSGFSRDIARLGMRFGLWFEPEMVNRDSDLYRAHPEYALETPGRTPCLGRNQLVLDLCNPAVRDYIVASVSGILDEARVSYVKWDMNRHISCAFSPVLAEQGRFYHSYILGLYDVLARIFRPRPHILLETCSSGGNRFDLGMLCYSPQVWSSDDTDAAERLKIQTGLSYLYPLSTMGAHVSACPNQQTLRETPLSARFNMAAFGCFGYELDLKRMSFIERRELRDQVTFYKAHRRTLQYGCFYRFDPVKPNKAHLLCVSRDGSEAVAGFFQTQSCAAEGGDRLPLAGLERDAAYTMDTKPQRLFIKRFGGLIRHVVPFDLNPNGFIMRLVNRFYALWDCEEHYEADGKTLMQGVRLNNQFVGSYYAKDIRLLGDFGSNLYVIRQRRDGIG